MTEIIRYSLLGKEDLALGTGTFEVRLADGRVVVLTKVDVGALLNDATISTQNLSLGTLTLTGLTVSGTLTLGSVTFTGDFDLTSGQIKFPATQVPSSNANTLDDYEEGTWTPSVGGTASYTTQLGTYIKIGRLVWVRCEMTINVIGTGSTTVISGLPFTADTNAAAAVSSTATLATALVSVSATIGGGTAVIACNGRTTASVSDASQPIFGSGALILITGVYTTAS